MWRAARQLRAAIAQRLSREHADLLAIPEADPSGRRIDWYAPFDGEVRRLADLGDGERGILAKVHRLHGEIAGLANSMDAPQRSGAERNFARLLRHALTAPGEETLYRRRRQAGDDLLGLLGRCRPARRLPAQPARPPRAATLPADRCLKRCWPRRRRSRRRARAAWWQWLLLALLLLLLLAGLAWLLRPYLPHLEPRLEAEARDRALGLSVRQPVELQKARVGTLQQDNENLRLELARLTDECRATAATAPPASSCRAASSAPAMAPIERGAAPDAPRPGPTPTWPTRTTTRTSRNKGPTTRTSTRAT